ncbi:hypothetical protein AX17_001631 [Amanita inopinata Kibby_2008]|nr:hypothetical protein AX17_001631 [Amanita inopinata Kibby_2008]
MSTQDSWKHLAAEKRQRRDSLIPKEWILPHPPPPNQLDVTEIPERCGILSAKEIEITNSSVQVLLANLATATWSAVEVTTAFAKRAVIAHQLTNCLTEIFIERALERAAWLDEQLKATGKVVGPFHGLPISLKDQVNIKGIESTMGYASWVGRFADKNALLADILESQGAVLYVKTNLPQTLVWIETYNLLFGRTTNPHNRSLSSGGSSGGEGALIALKGSPLGVGSDTGGSIRAPAAFNGLYGFRPSFNRLPYVGCVNSLDGQEAVLSVLGPMTRSLEGVKHFMKCVISTEPWKRDAHVLRQKWDEEAYKLAEHGGPNGKLCFGILWNDGVVQPHPPNVRALEMVKSALVAKGHKVIDWEPFKHAELIENTRVIYGAGGTEEFKAETAATGEPIITTMSPQPDEQSVWPNLEETEEIAGMPVFTEKTLSAYELWEVHKERRRLRQAYVEHWLATESKTGTGRPVDAIIAPVAPYVAAPHGTNKLAFCTWIWNNLDFPALVIPVTKIDQELDAKKPAHAFFGDLDRKVYNFYDPARFANAPVGVQIIGRTGEDEALVGMAEVADRALSR